MDGENCIWFHQTDGVRNRLIGFYQNSGEGLPQAPPRARCQNAIGSLTRFSVNAS